MIYLVTVGLLNMYPGCPTTARALGACLAVSDN